MANNELLQKVRAKAEAWLAPQYDEATRKEVQALLDNPDTTELVDAFYKDLEFGTGGLRGIMGAGSNRMNRYTVGTATQGLANYLIKEFGRDADLKVAIGYDCRHNSSEFSRMVAGIFAANGIKVYLYEALRPTPMVSYAIRELGCQSGVMLTASHNPKEYNGFKAYWSDGAQMIAPHDQNVIDEVNAIKSIAEIKFDGPSDMITLMGKEMDDKFIKEVLSKRLSPEVIKRQHDLKIVFTPLHGTSGQVLPRCLKEAGFDNVHPVKEQMVVSGDFPTVESPNPENASALKMAIDQAKAIDAEIVMATDPDGDRIGTAVKDKEGNWVLINGNQTCLLYAYYAIEKRREAGELKDNQYLVKTIVTTDLIKTIAERNNIELYDTYTGFKWIADVIRKNEGKKEYLGGGEESYGYLWSDFVRDKCSVSACTIFAEIAAWAKDKGQSIYELLEHIYLQYGYSLEKNISVVRPGKSGAEEIQAMMQNFRSNPLKELAGSKVTEVLDYQSLKSLNTVTGETKEIVMPTTSNVLQYRCEDGTKLSIRPSGTEPKIKFYIEVHAQPTNLQELEEAKKVCARRADEIAKQLGI
ncbi:MAG: phospho-sugar mutase [Porphyromonas somerae]|uniref:phospho-sugar mutase n=1 Tax=Porphyromonas somerae TaxID=322095 RepID=UPI0026EC20F8|nr:phospho-sugar mutase [Porphyromonas somerae]MDD7558430.1 phospho-sugar mutase [Porphyromonas somerae]MDY3119464.1 phospho-sugar mutase [Porphyromonas somerae]MDY5816125.1 phospho-sugar mutase [Porphyromonas somerae]